MRTGKHVGNSKMNDKQETSKRIMVAGTVDAGKTTLIKALFHEGPVSMEKDKTQSMKYETNAIDTPGEFTASPFMKGALFSTALEADLILFLQDATSDFVQFPPGFATGFPRRSVGVVFLQKTPTNQQRVSPWAFAIL